MSDQTDWEIPVPNGIVYPSMSLDAATGEKIMHLVATREQLLGLAANITAAAGPT